MAKRKLSATQKLRANVRRQISRMEQRGYFVDTEIKEKLKSAKYQTLKSYQRNKYSKLYSESTALSDRGKIISGTEYRQQERKESARKAATTRRERKSVREREFNSQDYYEQLETKQDYYEELERKRQEYQEQFEEQKREEDYDDIWEQQRREQDTLDYINAKAYQEGEIKYNEIVKLIEQYPTKGAESLKEALKNQIENYGKNSVITAIGMAPDYYVEHAREIIYYEENATAIYGAFLDFFELITGTIPTDEEAKQLGDTLDAMTDFETR